MGKFNKGDVVRFVGGKDEWIVSEETEAGELLMDLNENIKTAIKNYDDKVELVKAAPVRKEISLSFAVYREEYDPNNYSISFSLFRSEEEAKRVFGYRFVKMTDPIVTIWVEE